MDSPIQKDKEQIKTFLTFKEFLNQNTNLLTVFGILNTLAIFAASIQQENEGLSHIITFILWLMSLQVWWEVTSSSIDYYEQKNKESWKFRIFTGNAFLLEFFFFIYFVGRYLPFLLIILFASIYFGLVYISSLLIAKLSKTYLSRVPHKHIKLATFMVMLLSTVLAVIILKFIGKYTSPYISEYLDTYLKFK